MIIIFQVVIKLIPVLLLLVLGCFIRHFHILGSDTVEDLKKIVINISLPSLLFLTFAKTSFQASYFIVIVTVLISCTFILIIGTRLKFIIGSIKYSESIFAGCETGLIGYSMFSLVYGTTDLYKLAVIDIGNSIFINVILLCYIKHLNGETVSAKQTVLGVFKAPTVISIIAGILVGCGGVYKVLAANAVSMSVLSLLNMLGTLTTPLICIVIGYSLQVNLKGIWKPIVIVLLRFAVNLAFAFSLYFILIHRFFPHDKMFEIALFMMFLLPPSFVLPVFIKNPTREEGQTVLTSIAFSLLLSLVAYPILAAFL